MAIVCDPRPHFGILEYIPFMAPFLHHPLNHNPNYLIMLHCNELLSSFITRYQLRSHTYYSVLSHTIWTRWNSTIIKATRTRLQFLVHRRYIGTYDHRIHYICKYSQVRNNSLIDYNSYDYLRLRLKNTFKLERPSSEDQFTRQSALFDW